MKTRFFKVSNLLLGSLIAALGLGACKTAQQKRMALAYGPPPTQQKIGEFVGQQQDDAQQREEMQKKEAERQRIERGNIKLVYGPPPSRYRDALPDPDGIYDIVDDMPSFRGDVSAEEWIRQHLRYPAKSRQRLEQGRVIVSFIVRKDGTLDGVTVVKSVASLLDQEAVRVVKSMPKWEPGRHRGEAVNVRYVLTVTFTLE